MPKILRILNRFNVGGPTYNATYLTKYMPKEYQTMLIGGVHDKSEASSLYIPEKFGIKPIVIKEMKREINPIDDRKAFKKIKQIIADFQPDIVHTHASKAGYLGRKTAFKMNVPIVVHTFHGHVFHSYFSKAKTTVFKKIEQRLASKSQAIIAISEQQKKELCETHKICSPYKTHVIPLGFDLDKFSDNTETKRKAFRKKYGLQEEIIAIGIIGRLAPVKNHLFFLKAISELNSKVQIPFKAFVIGGGELEEELKKTAKEYDIEQNIVFTSWIKDIDEPMAGLDIITLTSYNEGTPVSIIEAQATGKPVISVDAGGVKNIIKDEESGYIVPQGALQEYTVKLKELIENQTLRKSFGTIGKEVVIKKYHYKRLIADMDNLYKELLNKHKSL